MYITALRIITTTFVFRVRLFFKRFIHSYTYICVLFSRTNLAHVITKRNNARTFLHFIICASAAVAVLCWCTPKCVYRMQLHVRRRKKCMVRMKKKNKITGLLPYLGSNISSFILVRRLNYTTPTQRGSGNIRARPLYPVYLK
jgi:hypothetical protein